MNRPILALCATAVLALAGTAQAANYTFNVLYSGGGVAALAPGSDDPLSTVLATGDSFTYRLTATGDDAWTVLTDNGVFPRFAMSGSFYIGPDPAVYYPVDYLLTLNDDAAPVFSFGESTFNCCAHVGTNTLALPTGLVFDEWVLTVTIGATTNVDPFYSLLPWPGQAPELYSPNDLSYSGNVPEPASWTMMIAGFGLVGAAVRRRQVALVA
jgi:hypothetical protein